MRVEIVSENVGAGIMVLGCMQLENIPMHAQRLNCNENNCKLVGSCWGKKHQIGTCYQDLSLYETIFLQVLPIAC